MASSAVARGEGSIPASLVDTERRPPSNRILEKAVFTNVSKSKSLVAVPGVVHFGGFNVDQTHVLTLVRFWWYRRFLLFFQNTVADVVMM
eukprot:m.223819 g.223819  ORF g.223819 m.223819 type:complete len:90 (-) comp18759_c0_seq4:2800-3069(-)